uniref:Uncharacterized protein n=1 Tax=Anopheles epiroticus TaxID=199890 RepID=A0A182PKL2_9DIPT
MLLQLDGGIEGTAANERLQRSSGSSSSTRIKDIIIPAARNEAINGTVPGRPLPTEARTYAHATVAMAHGNSSATLTSALVPRPPTTSTAPTEPPPGRKVDILIYPTVAPETIVVPILSCIVGFPIFALLVICCLRRRAKIARERDRRRNFDLKANTITLVRFNSHHRKYLAGVRERFRVVPRVPAGLPL